MHTYIYLLSWSLLSGLNFLWSKTENYMLLLPLSTWYKRAACSVFVSCVRGLLPLSPYSLSTWYKRVSILTHLLLDSRAHFFLYTSDTPSLHLVQEGCQNHYCLTLLDSLIQLTILPPPGTGGQPVGSVSPSHIT